MSALAAALSNSVGTSPPRFGTPPIRAQSPSLAAGGSQSQAPAALTPTNYGSFEARSRLMQSGATGAYEDPEIIKRHLVQPSDNSDAGVVPAYDPGKGKQPGDGTDADADHDDMDGPLA